MKVTGGKFVLVVCGSEGGDAGGDLERFTGC